MGLADRIGRRIRLRDLHICWRSPNGAAWRRHPLTWRSRTRSSPKRSPTWSERWGCGCSIAIPTASSSRITDARCSSAGVTVFDEMRQGLKRIEFLADPASGELRIGCPGDHHGPA